MKKQLKLYVGCSLAHAPKEFIAEVEALKDKLRADFEVADFVGLVDGEPKDVYHWDIQNCVANCDLFVAICDYPSLGLGYELASAIEHYKKPVLALAQNDALVSRLVLGIDHPNYEFKRYGSVEDIAALVKEKAATL